jgi:fatty acyl-CoA reductase
MKNVQGLWEKLDEEDRKLFDFDLEGLDWDKYFYNYGRGVRVYLLKDELTTVPLALAKYKRYITLITRARISMTCHIFILASFHMYI